MNDLVERARRRAIQQSQRHEDGKDYPDELTTQLVDEIKRLRETLEKIEKQTDCSDKEWLAKLNRTHVVRMLAVANQMARDALRKGGEE